MIRIAVFGGTSEGRVLAGLLADAGAEVGVFVATSYGEGQIRPREGIAARSGRLDTDEMASVFKTEVFDCVVDATHPYAGEATANLLAAADEAGLFYLRVKRGGADDDGGIQVENAEAAARYLSRISGNVLLTTGSSTLGAFTGIENWRERIFARVLPDTESLKKCESLGFSRRNLICMQGPFTHEMNAATIKMYDISAVVTKDSGIEGGFPEKLSAAQECGVKLIVIRRPAGKEGGVSVKEAVSILTERLKLGQPKPQHPRFPLFIPLEGKSALIVGGGKVAARRARVLLDFGASITVVSPEICADMREIAGPIAWNQQCYNGIDKGFSLVVAATGDRRVNHQAGEDAKMLGIPVSVADRGEESTFWFPAIARGGGIVAGLVSEDGNHGAVKRAAVTVRKALGENV